MIRTTKVRSQMVLQPQTWYRAVVTFDGRTVLLYVNGVRVATAPVIAPFELAAPNLRFAGDEITFGEIRVLAQAGLFARYNFDEESGAAAADSSGHENDATLSGSWEWVPVEQPHLDWSQAGNSLVVSWPAGSGWILESTDNLVDPKWAAVTDMAVQVVGGKNTVTANTSIGTNFFRLAG